MITLKVALNLKSIVKLQETKKQNLLEKQLHTRNFRPRNQQTLMKFREIFTTVKIIIMKKLNYFLKTPILKIIIM